MLSAARIGSILLAIYGFVMGIMVAITLMITSSSLTQEGVTNSELMMFTQLGNWVLVLFPLMYLILFAIFGFILSAIGSWIYNIVASKTGGVEIELSK